MTNYLPGHTINEVMLGRFQLPPPTEKLEFTVTWDKAQPTWDDLGVLMAVRAAMGELVGSRLEIVGYQPNPFTVLLGSNYLRADSYAFCSRDLSEKFEKTRAKFDLRSIRPTGLRAPQPF